jgi:hypothetical protein
LIDFFVVEILRLISNNSRQKARRKSERRSKERRINNFEFSSPEWREMIQQEYLLWPKEDRRKADRRSSARRVKSRRVDKNGKARMPRQPRNLLDLLTKEEKNMINELMQSDDSD